MPSNDSIEEVIKREGVLRYPNEACGFVINKGKKTITVACENVASDPSLYFEISASDYSKYSDIGEIVGVWHTHPEGNSKPSDTDIKGCKDSELMWYIVGVIKEGGEFRFSALETVVPIGDSTPYVGRSYIPNVFDCYTLVQDYYDREFGIKIGDYQNEKDWWLSGKSYFEDMFQKEGFVVVTDAPKIGDVYFIQTDSPVANHVAIHVKEDTILHHTYNRLSKHDMYYGYWEKHTVKRVRHNTKC